MNSAQKRVIDDLEDRLTAAVRTFLIAWDRPDKRGVDRAVEMLREAMRAYDDETKNDARMRQFDAIARLGRRDEPDDGEQSP